MNPNNERDLRRFYDSFEWSGSKLRPFRENRFAAIQQLVGGNYSDDGTDCQVYINLIEQGVSTYLRQLAAKNPQVMVESPYPDLKPAATELEIAVNHMIHEINLLQALREVVQEAIFSPSGILKLGMCIDEGASFNHVGGQYYADPVTLDDWVQDMSVTRFDQISYCGNRYRMRLEEAREFPGFKKKRRQELKASKRSSFNHNSDERAETLSQGTDHIQEEYTDFVDLYEIWLPAEKLIVTCEADSSGFGMLTGKPLGIWEWTGPRRGPYHQLSFSTVPGNAMGLPTVANWMGLHELINQIMRKLADQALRQKSVFTYTGESEEDARRVVESKDGETFQTDNPNAVQSMDYGGINQVSLGFMLQMRDMFSAMAGNLDVLGGISPQADTYGQERLLAESASKRIDDMQDQVITFTTAVCQDLAEYLYYDPLIEIPITKRLGGTKYTVTTTWPVRDGVDLRDGDFFEYNFSVVPHSMEQPTPSSRLNTISQFFNQFVLPNMQAMQEQGIAINYEKLFRLIAKLSNMKDLEEMLMFVGQPQAQPEKPIIPAAQKPAHTSHTSERVNRPGASNQGKSQIMQSLMFGGNPQSSEMASLTRMAT